MPHPLTELVLGGQRSGKSACGLARAADWLRRPGHQATLLATATASDAEMQARIDAHRRERAARLPALHCHEEPRALPAAIRRLSTPGQLLLVDCLPLWLTNLCLPAVLAEPPPWPALDEAGWQAMQQSLVEALHAAPGPVVLVSGEIGLAPLPDDALTQRFVADLGRLHQALAACCPRVTLVLAGLEQALKR